MGLQCTTVSLQGIGRGAHLKTRKGHWPRNLSTSEDLEPSSLHAPGASISWQYRSCIAFTQRCYPWDTFPSSLEVFQIVRERLQVNTQNIPAGSENPSWSQMPFPKCTAWCPRSICRGIGGSSIPCYCPDHWDFVFSCTITLSSYLAPYISKLQKR